MEVHFDEGEQLPFKLFLQSWNKPCLTTSVCTGIVHKNYLNSIYIVELSEKLLYLSNPELGE